MGGKQLNLSKLYDERYMCQFIPPSNRVCMCPCFCTELCHKKYNSVQQIFITNPLERDTTNNAQNRSLTKSHYSSTSTASSTAATLDSIVDKLVDTLSTITRFPSITQDHTLLGDLNMPSQKATEVIGIVMQHYIGRSKSTLDPFDLRSLPIIGILLDWTCFRR